MGFFLPMLAGAALSAGGAALAAKGGKGGGPAWSIAPEYPEAEGARKVWWEKLQKWGDDPTYGAITPDWANIWQQAKQKVNEYYSGTPTAIGAFGRLKGQFAARNVSNSPAEARSLARLAAEESGAYRDMAQTEAINKAEFSERARQDWLQNIANLQSQKPNAQFYQEPQKTSKSQMWGAALSGLGQGLMTYGIGNMQANLAQKQQDMLFKNLGVGKGGPATTTYGIKVPSTYTPWR